MVATNSLMGNFQMDFVLDMTALIPMGAALDDHQVNATGERTDEPRVSSVQAQAHLEALHTLEPLFPV